MTDVIDITKKLIECPSVTPDDAGAQVYLSAFLKDQGFQCEHLQFAEVPNLFARYGNSGKHLCYAGHTDVVPPGPEGAWTYGPFNPTIKDGVLYGRGASDMKGSVAAFTAAAAQFIANNKNFKGSISLLITGDEEGPGVNGTLKVLEWMKANNQVPDVCLVGEPTNPNHHGQEIKIGRRGSLSARISVSGKQGHTAYPQLADNPLPRFIKLLDALASHEFDKGTEFFQPTNLQITTIDVGNKAGNVIPASATAAFGIRFNDLWDQKKLEKKIREVLDAAGGHYDLEIYKSNSDSFLTQPGQWTELVKKAVIDVTGKTPKYTTNGGTSDARFAHKYCPVVEYGAVNDTIHQVNENAKVKDLEDLVKVYTRILELYFS